MTSVSGVPVPEEIRERIYEALNEADAAGLPTIREPGEMGTTLSYSIDWRSLADAVLGVLDHPTLLALLDTCPTDAAASVALPRDTSLLLDEALDLLWQWYRRDHWNKAGIDCCPLAAFLAVNG